MPRVEDMYIHALAISYSQRVGEMLGIYMPHRVGLCVVRSTIEGNAKASNMERAIARYPRFVYGKY